MRPWIVSITVKGLIKIMFSSGNVLNYRQYELAIQASNCSPLAGGRVLFLFVSWRTVANEKSQNSRRGRKMRNYRCDATLQPPSTTRYQSFRVARSGCSIGGVSRERGEWNWRRKGKIVMEGFATNTSCFWQKIRARDAII